ncbi:MAG: type I phosphomannose isomerase catalytic subunit [Mycoplasmatales bacterium]
MQIIKFDYVINKKLWGQEHWLISAHEHGMGVINNGQYQGLSLQEFFDKHKDLLGIAQDKQEFPLLMKIIEAHEDLSIQVHPDDEYAQQYENSLGKSECWYILEAQNTDIIVGQNEKTKAALADKIQNKQIMTSLNRFPIQKGDFFYIPAGTVHAIRHNTKILEIQQSSDITYRLYDYERVDKEGNLRELHVAKSLDVIDYNYQLQDQSKVTIENEDFQSIILTDNKYFIVEKIIIKNKFKLHCNKYKLGYVLSGMLQTKEEQVQASEAFMLLKDTEIVFQGQGELILTTSK